MTRQLTAVPALFRQVSLRTSTKVVLLVLYGVAVAAIALGVSEPQTPAMMGARIDDVAGSLRTMRAGGPPLLTCVGASDAELEGGDFVRLIEEKKCQPAGYTDDQGLSLFLPLVALATGTSDPPTALRTLFVACLGLLLALYPLLFGTLLGSVPAGLAAPWVVIGIGGLTLRADHYWIPAWGAMLALPLLMVTYRHWERLGRWRWTALLAAALLGSFLTAMRIHSGLPIVIACLLVVLWRVPRWGGRVALAGAVLVAYLSIYPFGLQAVRAYRDHSIGDPSLSDRYPARHPFWHNAYIGLGLVPNEHGIRWDDAVASDYVKRVRPDAEYLSDEYENALRDEYFRLLREDPGLVAENVLVKADTLVREAGSDYHWLALALVPLAVSVGTRRRLLRRCVVLAAPAVLLGGAPLLITNPGEQYLVGWTGPVCLLAVLGVTWAIAEIPEARRRRWRQPTRAEAVSLAPRAMRSAWFWSGAAVATVVIAIVSLRAAFPPSDPVRDHYALNATPLGPVAQTGNSISIWRFWSVLPVGWSFGGEATAQPASTGVLVTTDTGASTYQLVGPDTRLAPGTYELRLEGAVFDGGLELGVLDVAADAWIAQTRYWYGQAPFAKGVMATRFTLAREATVRPVLANWSPEGTSSRWRVDSVSVVGT